MNTGTLAYNGNSATNDDDQFQLPVVNNSSSATLTVTPGEV
jgi:hypothetical protein